MLTQKLLFSRLSKNMSWQMRDVIDFYPMAQVQGNFKHTQNALIGTMIAYLVLQNSSGCDDAISGCIA